MKTNKSILFIFSLLISNLGFCQNDTLQSTKSQIIDSSSYLTRYTNLPISNKPLKTIDQELLEVHHVNPINRIDNSFYQQLSTDGSAHNPLFFVLPQINNFSYQPSVFSATIFTRENIRFYNVYKAYSELKYSNTLNNSRYFSVIHAQNVYKNLQIALQYDVNYADGSYENSSTMNQFFNITARYKDSLGVYEGYIGFIRNRAMQNESGGLLSDSSFRVQQYSSLNAYPVNINAAYTKYKSFDIFLSQKLNFGKKLPSTIFKNLALIHDFSYYSNSRIYYDMQPRGGFYDTSYYSETLTNDSLALRRVQNVLSINNNSLSTIGIRHDYLVINDSINVEKSSLLTPFVNLGIGTKKSNINIFGDYIISSSRYNKDYCFGANASLEGSLTLNNTLDLRVEKLQKSVDYFFTKYYSNNFKWENEFEKIDVFHANASYTIKFKESSRQLIMFSVDYFQFNNLVFIDNDLSPKQYKTKTNLYQASLRHNIRKGMFNFEGIATLQEADNNDALRVPVFQAKQSISINFKIFGKKLDTYIGFDFRYNTAYYADAYMPAMGSFYRQNQTLIGDYLYTDFFIQTKLERAKIFVVLTHPYSGKFGYGYYATPHYPNENLNFRFGVSWRFFD